MGLRDLKIPEEVVEIPGGSFAVRGLNTDDMAYLIRKHGASMEKAYASFADSNENFTPEDLKDFLVPLLEYAPELLAELIACAADDMEAVPVARRLPFPSQVDALEKIAQLTFEVAGGPKKFLETVTRLLQGTTGLLQSLGT